MIYNYFIMLQFNRYDYIYDVYIGEESLKYQLRVDRGATEESKTLWRRVIPDAKPNKNRPNFLGQVYELYMTFSNYVLNQIVNLYSYTIGA